MRALVLLALAACAPPPPLQNTWVHAPDYYSVNADGTRSARYSRVDAYTAFGTSALGAQAVIAPAYERAQHAPPPARELVVFDAELPPGITVDGATMNVDPRAPYEPIGRFDVSYVLAAAPEERDIVDDLQRLAQVAAGDAVVIVVQHVGAADARVRAVEGFVLRRRAPVAHATHAHRQTARLDYTAAPECPSGDQIARAIAARLGYSPWAAAAPTTLHAEIAKDGRGFAASLRVGDARVRHLSAGTCKGVSDALVSIAVIQLDAPAS